MDQKSPSPSPGPGKGPAGRPQSFSHDSTIRSATLVVAITGSFIVPFMGSSVNVILPAMEKNLHIDAVLLSWVATAYLLAAGIILVPMGRLGDIIGRKKVLGFGYALFAAGSLAVSSAGSFPVLLAFRTLQGMGSGMIFGTSTAILTSVFPPEERGKVLGVTTSAVYVGLSSGPFVAGILVQQFSWRVLFILTFILSFIPLVFILTRLKGEWADAAGESYDTPGAFIFGLALFALVYGFSKLPGVTGLTLLAIGIPAGVLFIFRQIRIPSPLIDISLFTQNRVFARSNLAALIHYGSTFGLNFLLSLYLQYVKGLSPQATGAILIAQPVMMALGSPFAGRLSDRREPRILATTGMSMTFAGLLAMAFLHPATPVPFIVFNLVFLGCGFALFSSPNMNAIMSSVEKRHLGLASGSAATMRLMGQMFSMGLVTMIISLLMGKTRISPETYPALLQCIRISFSLFSGLCVFGIIASFSRGNVRGRDVSD